MKSLNSTIVEVFEIPLCSNEHLQVKKPTLFNLDKKKNQQKNPLTFPPWKKILMTEQIQDFLSQKVEHLSFVQDHAYQPE